MTTTPEEPDVSTLTYEQARAELAEVVQRLEAGGTTLEESLALWERGEALADTCQSWLDGARERLEVVRAARAGGTDHAAGGVRQSGSGADHPAGGARHPTGEPDHGALERSG